METRLFSSYPTQGYGKRHLRGVLHSCRFDSYTERVVRPSLGSPFPSLTTMILRGMMHDPAVFAEPDRFYPERWLQPEAPAFPNQVFGFGARQNVIVNHRLYG